MGKPAICIGENKGADQLSSNCESVKLIRAIVFATRIVKLIPLLSKSKISSLYPSSLTVQPGLCRTWSEPKIVGFLAHMLNYELPRPYRLKLSGKSCSNASQYECKTDDCDVKQ